MYVYGKNVVTEMIKDNKKINKAYIYKKYSDDCNIDYLIKKNVKINYVEKYELDKIVTGNHQGIILDIEDYKYVDIDELLIKENPLLVILDHLEDPHNLGAIIRTCEAAGVDGVIIPKDRSVEVNGTVMKTSVGTVNNVKISRVTNIVNTIKYLKEKGFWITGTDMNGTRHNKLDFKGKTAIVIGNEGSGMSRLVTESCDFIASIPMFGETNSLNASVATAIVVYEAVLQREQV